MNKKDYQDLVYLNLVGMSIWEQELLFEDRPIDEAWDLLAYIFNNNEASHLTVCPECHVDDFNHVEGCTIGKFCEDMLSERALVPEYEKVIPKKSIVIEQDAIALANSIHMSLKNNHYLSTDDEEMVKKIIMERIKDAVHVASKKNVSNKHTIYKKIK